MKQNWKQVRVNKLFNNNFNSQNIFFFLLTHVELEALTDELATDTDTAYLDEINAPSVPSKVPEAEKAGDGQVDEFGLPKIAAT